MKNMQIIIFIVIGRTNSMVPKNDRKMLCFIVLFWVIFATSFCYFCYCFPTYVCLKSQGYPVGLYKIWREIDHFILNIPVLKKIYLSLLFKVNAKTLFPVIIIMVANISYGAMLCYKKWWYYLVAVITIIMCLILHDCYNEIIELRYDG